MSDLLTHGLSALMEACKMSERSENADEEMMEAMSEIDDDLISAMTDGELEDSVENDMAGEGVGDDAEMEKLLEKIPPSDEGINNDIEDLVESFIPSDLSEYVGG